MNDKVKQTLNIILDQFKSGDIPEVVVLSMFPIPNLPCSKWSLLNRTLVFLHGTMDARGYRQWQQANRYVKKGSKAIYILVPFIKKVDDDGQEKMKLYGFGCRPVYRFEDTDGASLEQVKIELPEFPLIQRAQEWGLSVKAIPGNYRYRGYYSSRVKEIALAYRLDVYGNPQTGQWLEVGPTDASWNGALLGVAGAEIAFHAVGPNGSLPSKSVLNYPMEGLKLNLGDKEYVAWAVQNELDDETSYFTKIDGFPESVLFGPYSSEDETEVHVVQLK